MKQQDIYWSNRYKEGLTGWDIGNPSTPLKEYIDQIENKSLRILIPGAGNAYEAEYLHKQGFTDVSVLDISLLPLSAFKDRVSTFPDDHLIHADFFNFNGEYDLILEQTFFCSFEPSMEKRSLYGKQMSTLLKEGGKLVGVWFNHPLVEESNRPYGGNKSEYLSYLRPYFEVKVFEECYNSIPARKKNELFGIFIKM